MTGNHANGPRAWFRQIFGLGLEIICADFLAGANLENDNPGVLVQSALRFFQFFPSEERKAFFD